MLKLLRISVLTAAVTGCCLPNASLLNSCTGQETSADDPSDAVTVEAYGGTPFGVARITIPYSRQRRHAVDLSRRTPSEALCLLGPNAFYPAVERSSIAGGEDGIATTWRIYFLFLPPKDNVLTFRHPLTGSPVTVEVRESPEGMQRTQDRWWKLFQAAAQSYADTDSYPPEIDQYLLLMLSRRLNLSARPLRSRRYFPEDGVAEFAGQLTGSEAIRLAMQKETLLNTKDTVEAADLPIPEPVSPPAVSIPATQPDVPVEPIAHAVPHDCFYMRFGSFSNFRWFRDRMNDWGADLRDLASARAVDFHISDRIQHRMQLSDDLLSQIVGELLIDDVAVIGADTFVREGAEIGIVFQARNSALLRAALIGSRDQTADGNGTLKLTPVTISGSDVEASLLSSDDQSVRSFYAAVGDNHFITTSEALLNSLVHTAEGTNPSLGASEEFRYARTKMAVDRDDTAFLYLSDAFFRRFVSPAFRIEMTRRARSDSEIQTGQLARLAARAEGAPCDTIEDLIAGGFLPPHYGRHADGSSITLLNGRFTDSLRGPRGSFLPIGDVPVKAATKTEVEAYRNFSRRYQRIWQAMDPAAVAIRHSPVTESESDLQQDGSPREKIEVDVHVYPVPRQGLFWLTFLRAKSASQMIPRPPNVIFMLQGLVFDKAHLFTGLLDADMPFAMVDNQVRAQISQEPPMNWFYGGADADEVLNMFLPKTNIPKGDIVGPDNFGWFSETYAKRSDDFFLASGGRETIEQVFDHLKVTPAERAAQFRLSTGDIAESRISTILHAGMWSQNYSITMGNAACLNRLRTQYHLARDDIMPTAAELFGGEIVCPLGGSYKIELDEHMRWISKRIWQPTADDRWEDYRHSFLNRLHEVEVELTVSVSTPTDSTLTSHVEFVIDTND